MKTNRLNKLFDNKKDFVSIYYTAGYPKLDDTTIVLKALEKAGVDFVEIGMPYSDPLADGPVIQNSGTVALKNGMSLKVLLKQLEGVRDYVKMPIVLMGYINPIMRFGFEEFLKKCSEVGIDGLIIPDLPFELYEEKYKTLFEKYNISNIFLITPQTPEDRVILLDNGSTSFIYMVANAAVTGAKTGLSQFQLDYFNRFKNMNLKTPCMVGFGISNNETYSAVCKYSHGAIIGSAFVNVIGQSNDLEKDINSYIESVLNK